MVGFRALDYKKRREFRRQNHIAKDLKTDKYHQRVVPSKRRKSLNDSDEYFFEDAAYADELDPEGDFR